MRRGGHRVRFPGPSCIAWAVESHGSLLSLHLSGWQINLTMDLSRMGLGDRRSRKICEGSGEIRQVTEKRGQCGSRGSTWRGEERCETGLAEFQLTAWGWRWDREKPHNLSPSMEVWCRHS